MNIVTFLSFFSFIRKQEIYIPKEVADDDLFQQGISSGINFDKFDKIPVCCIIQWFLLNFFI